VWVEVSQDFASENPKSIWIYALVAPFPTVTDGVKLEDIKTAWSGKPSEAFGSSPLLMTEGTREIFSTLWGSPSGEAVKIVESDKLLETAWNGIPSWAIIPFQDLEPRWKVLAVDGQSPIHREFDPVSYPLSVSFLLQGSIPDQQQVTILLPASNLDPDKLTTVILTGVTALVRATAYTMEKKGVTYPGRDIRAIMKQADIAHISNEIPFFSRCGYPPNPGLKKLVFCTYPRYMDLLTDIGTDVIELTGNHFGDYGPEAMVETLSIYNSDNIPYYGGGADLVDSLKPALFEQNGNKIAFIGCNRPDIGKFPTATDNRPGAAPCDYKYLPQKIRELTDQGYLVISTFQWNERDEYDPVPIPEQLSDFHLMADSGAVIVSGSQAHFPMAMEFYSNAFLHYGLGNLFFDQMGECCAGEYNRWEFMDRYTIYEGRLASVELLTMMLEDYSRPRPMTQPERTRFLNEYFHYSGWTALNPTPIPQPTVTLTPIQLPPVQVTPAS
jgi:poly-gamma-glutamate synthesis protein (capsule biosynthesis protein)